MMSFEIQMGPKPFFQGRVELIAPLNIGLTKNLLNTKIQLIIANENWMWPIKTIALPKKFLSFTSLQFFM